MNYFIALISTIYFKALEVLSEYTDILKEIKGLGYIEAVDYLKINLLSVWIKAYKLNNRNVSCICQIKLNDFEYVYDDIESLDSEKTPPEAESRLVVVFGESKRREVRRDDYRLQGWLGQTETVFGKEWDKGHFIGHSIGGAIDGAELNVFQQRRDINRGWSEEGKIFRKMEKYCGQNEGIFCFNRPFYSNQGSKPSKYEFGVLLRDKTLWVETFNNEL